jgi:hypothetical protein
MIYDARSRRVVERSVLQPEKPPAEQTWFTVDKLNVFFVGEKVPAPPPSPAEPKERTGPPADLPEREVRRRSQPRVDGGAEQKATNAQRAADAWDSIKP